MIAHVAAAGEQRGRVVLHLRSAHPSPLAIEAAMRIAQAFQSELESLFVEDVQLREVARFPFAREITLSGRRGVALSPEGVAEQSRLVAGALQRRVGEMARLAEVPLRTTIVCDEPVRAVAEACAAHGPWNVVALADPLSGAGAAIVRRLFEGVPGTTGVVVVGSTVRRSNGPIIAALEDIGHLEPMRRLAERLLAASGDDQFTLMLVARSEAEAGDMEDQARLALGADPAVKLARVVARHGIPVELAEALRRACGSFVLARFGGLLTPADSDLRHLATALECPLLLMR